MSRMPQTVPRPKSSTGLRTQFRATGSKSPTPPTPSRSRVTSPAKRQNHSEPLINNSPPKERLSVRDQIALKRAQAKKGQAKNDGLGQLDALGDDELLHIKSLQIEEPADEMGRLGVRETVSRARSTGLFVIYSLLLRMVFTQSSLQGT